ASFSLNARGQEHPRPGVSTVQNRQGYCSCCNVHYTNLEQHVVSSQHRNFTTSCRSRMRTGSLMERFLQDVLQHHPHRYHDNRSTYEDIPLPVSTEAASIARLSPEKMEKQRNRDRQEISSEHQEFVGEIFSSDPGLSDEVTKQASVTQAFIKKLERKEDDGRVSQKSVGICSSEKWDTLKDAQFANHSHEGQFTAGNPVPQCFPVSPLVHSSSV
ncbi:ZDBF2 protein, partial [Chloroceryle aenea]|nr:ZDBF2 protein [Chloroceryle aenea]